MCSRLKNLGKLQSLIDEYLCERYRSLSRVHPMRTLTNERVKSYIKRDDELSFSISGSKVRKYLTLVPYLKKNQVQNVVLIGGAYSNHIVGLSQLLIENGIKPTLFLRKAVNEILQGNRFFLQLLVPPKEIHWIERTEWHHVEQLAAVYGKQQETNGEKTMVIPEGACMKEALLGAMTLALDIMRNQEEHQLKFDQIFVDAGTGLQAIALILGLSYLSHSGKVNVVLLADDENIFHRKLSQFHSFFQQMIGNTISFPKNYQLHLPYNAPSFGSVNQKIIEKIYLIAQNEGIFLDPIYSAKLVLEGERIIGTQGIEGNVLFVHSGGALTLTGYVDRILNQEMKRRVL